MRIGWTGFGLITTSFLRRSSGKGCHSGSMALCPFGLGHGFPCGLFLSVRGKWRRLCFGECLCFCRYNFSIYTWRRLSISSFFRVPHHIAPWCKSQTHFPTGSLSGVQFGRQYANNVKFVELCFFFFLISCVVVCFLVLRVVCRARQPSTDHRCAYASFV